MLALVGDDDLGELSQLATERAAIERCGVEPDLELFEPQGEIENSNVGRRRCRATAARPARQRADGKGSADEGRTTRDEVSSR